MARKKTKQKKHITSRRRSRMGAINADTKNLLMQTIGSVAGAVIGSYVGKSVKDMAVKQSTTLSGYADYIEGGVQVLGGIFLPKLIKQKSPLITGLQMGMMTNGGLTIVKATGALDALGAISNYSVPMVKGMNTTSLQDVRSNYAPPMVGNIRTRSYGIAAHA